MPPEGGVVVTLPLHAPAHVSAVALAVNVIFDTVTKRFVNALHPQLLHPCTLTFPLLPPAITVIEAVFWPPVMVHPPGTVQL